MVCGVSWGKKLRKKYESILSIDKLWAFYRPAIKARVYQSKKDGKYDFEERLW